MNKERNLEVLTENDLLMRVSYLEQKIVDSLNEKLNSKGENEHYGGIFTYLFIGNDGTALLLGNDGTYSFKFDMSGADMGKLTPEELVKNYAQITKRDFPMTDYSEIPSGVDETTFSKLINEISNRHRAEVEDYLERNKVRLLKEMVIKMEECLLSYK